MILYLVNPNLNKNIHSLELSLSLSFVFFLLPSFFPGIQGAAFSSGLSPSAKQRETINYDLIINLVHGRGHCRRVYKSQAER